MLFRLSAKQSRQLFRSYASSPSRVPLFINGELLQSKTDKWIDLKNPVRRLLYALCNKINDKFQATQEILCRVPECTPKELAFAAKSASDAFQSWRKSSVLTRQRVMLNLQALIRDNMERIAESITLEQGKTLADARGDVLRGLQVVEHACSIPSLLMGEKLTVSKDMDTYSLREPLGIVGGVMPFNFPAMIPLWVFPLAIACGNTVILKPSEKDPGASMILADLAKQAGVPNGVFNIVHGAVDTVNFICDEPAIKAISFVGSDIAGKHIFSRGTMNGKRVQVSA